VIAAVLAAAALLATGSASAEAGRGRMPEPLLGESLTDLDGREAGELELDVTGLGLRRSGGGALWRGALEAEWRATERFGLGLDVGLASPGGAVAATALSLRAAASFSLFHGVEQDAHLQLEASAELFDRDDAQLIDPGESALPFAAGLRAGWRSASGLWTLRGYLGGSAGGTSAHLVPVRAQAALLLALLTGGRSPGFLGVELDGDWGRRAPVLIAPNVVLDGAPIGVRAKVGIAAPWSPQARAGEAALGLLVRLIVELDD
jgi:hypothetical protein